jgi:thiamine kinase-like enzyme
MTIALDRPLHPALRALRRAGLDTPCGRVQPLHRSPIALVYRLDGAGPDGGSLIAKRGDPASLRIEHDIYTRVLPHLPLASLRCAGWIEEARAAWLFIEEADGVDYDNRSEQHRRLAARWLAELHTHARELAPDGLPDAGPPRYLTHLIDGKRDILDGLGNPAMSSAERSLLDDLLTRYQTIEAAWPSLAALAMELAPTVIHGDFVDQNVRLRPDGRDDRVLVFDWEMAGWGSPAVDLASFALAGCETALDAYASITRSDRERVTASAHLGALFRTLAAIDWAADLGPLPRPSLFQLEWLREEPLSLLSIYREWLDQAMVALGI